MTGHLKLITNWVTPPCTNWSAKLGTRATNQKRARTDFPAHMQRLTPTQKNELMAMNWTVTPIKNYGIAGKKKPSMHTPNNRAFVKASTD